MSDSKQITESKQSDEIEAVLGDGKASVTVGLNESMGGPYGYSNVKVYVSITLTCDQSAKGIQDASDLAFKECVAFIDNTMPIAHTMLVAHLSQHYVNQ